MDPSVTVESSKVRSSIFGDNPCISIEDFDPITNLPQVGPSKESLSKLNLEEFPQLRPNGLDLSAVVNSLLNKLQPLPLPPVICQGCGSIRIMNISAKNVQRIDVSLKGVIQKDYIPDGFDIVKDVQGENCLEFEVCADCGKIVGSWPQ